MTSYSTQQAAHRIAFFGDSCIGIFDGVIVERDGEAGPFALLSALWRPFISAEMFFGAGRFDAAVTQLLWDLRILRASETESETFSPIPFRSSTSPLTHFVPRTRFAPAMLILSIGGADAYVLADSVSMDPSAPVADDELATEARRLLEPAFAGIRALRDAGVRVGVIALLPTLPPTPGGVDHRFRVVAAFNDAYRAFCASEGVLFFDTWEELVRDGIAVESYFASDRIHLTMEGACKVVARIMEQIGPSLGGGKSYTAGAIENRRS